MLRRWTAHLPTQLCRLVGRACTQSYHLTDIRPPVGNSSDPKSHPLVARLHQHKIDNSLTYYNIISHIQEVPDEALSRDVMRELESIFEEVEDRRVHNWFFLLTKHALQTGRKAVGDSLIEAFRNDASLRTAANYTHALGYLIEDPDARERLEELIQLMKSEKKGVQLHLICRELFPTLRRSTHWILIEQITDAVDADHGLERPDSNKCQNVEVKVDDEKLKNLLKAFISANNQRIIQDNLCTDVLDELMISADSRPHEIKAFERACTILLENLKINKNVISSVVAEQLFKWFLSFPKNQWSGQLNVSLGRKRYCSHCKHNFPPFILPRTQMDSLFKELHDMLKDNPRKMYTSEKQYNDFLIFLEENGSHFDCVIDVHNILLRKRGRIEQRFQNLERIIKFLGRTCKCRRFLLIGKEVRGVQRGLEEIKVILNTLGHTVVYFGADHQTKDDFLILDAALRSAPHCYVVSNDRFRQHLALLNEESQKTFFRWQASRQIDIDEFGNSVKLPSPIENTIHGDMTSGWHIPYFDNPYDRECLEPMAVPKWMCIHRQQN